VTTEEAIDHLRARLKTMDGTYLRSWPKWTATDNVAVQIVVREATQELERQYAAERAHALRHYMGTARDA
jgi:hypothetical protein